MPPLIAFAGVLGGLAVVRWAYKTAVRINQELEEARWFTPEEIRQGIADGSLLVSPSVSVSYRLLEHWLADRGYDLGAMVAAGTR